MKQNNQINIVILVFNYLLTSIYRRKRDSKYQETPAVADISQEIDFLTPPGISLIVVLNII